MTSAEIDDYLAALSDPQRTTLERLRRDLRDLLPGVEEGLSYGLPAVRVDGRVVAGFAAFKNHLSYLPHSGSVLSTLADEVAGYDSTKGSLHFPVDEPLPRELVERLVRTKLAALGLDPPPAS